MEGIDPVLFGLGCAALTTNISAIAAHVLQPGAARERAIELGNAALAVTTQAALLTGAGGLPPHGDAGPQPAPFLDMPPLPPMPGLILLSIAGMVGSLTAMAFAQVPAMQQNHQLQRAVTALAIAAARAGQAALPQAAVHQPAHP